MPKILTIDFDIIMYPCIKLYNNEVGGNANPTQLWDYLENTKEIELFLNYDAKVLLDIIRLLKIQTQEKHTPLTALEEHQEIIDCLKKFDSFEDKESFEITNIDFHHDIWYRDEDKNDIVSFDKYNCSNWLGYLYLTDKTKKITWYKASNSDCLLDEKIIDNMVNISKIPYLFKEDFDAIYLVKSPQWVHHKFIHLFDFLKIAFGDEL